MSKNNKSTETNYLNKFFGFLYLIFDVATAMVGNTIHGSTFWSIMDFLFAPLAWIKWLLYHEVSLSVLHQTFDFFLK
jgi:hypothetical protein